MRILHTSDWHIGKQLFGKKRYKEFDNFLNWVVDTIREEKIDILLVSGDIFDTTTPSNRAVELYFNFLNRVSKENVCKHIVIIAGNHDSPSFLEAPKEILKSLNIYIVASANIEDEVLRLEVGDSSVIICAVPFLRDRELRDSIYGESIEDREKKIVDAIKRHFRDVANRAKELRKEKELIIAMAHLFVKGENTKIGDGVRELYVGSIANSGIDIFDDSFSYVALGHLHIAQSVKRENIRYSGSPIAMGFGEAKQKKSVTILDIDSSLNISTLSVPVFQKLERVTGDLEKIESSLKALKALNESIWVEVIYNGSEVIGNLSNLIDEIISDSKIEVLKIESRDYDYKTLSKERETLELKELSVFEVFDKCLEYYEVDNSQIDELKSLYKEVVLSIEQEDVRAK